MAVQEGSLTDLLCRLGDHVACGPVLEVSVELPQGG